MARMDDDEVMIQFFRFSLFSCLVLTALCACVYLFGSRGIFTAWWVAWNSRLMLPSSITLELRKYCGEIPQQHGNCYLSSTVCTQFLVASLQWLRTVNRATPAASECYSAHFPLLFSRILKIRRDYYLSGTHSSDGPLSTQTYIFKKSNLL